MPLTTAASKNVGRRPRRVQERSRAVQLALPFERPSPLTRLHAYPELARRVPIRVHPFAVLDPEWDDA